tara:strand:+ start:399 stop:761 length:363 start_codon:yes stop_codon:yes gene_type:complete
VDKTTKIFVYGSLMRGFYNHSVLYGAKFLKNGITKRDYVLYDLGGFPGMVKNGNNSILGEIYEVDSLTLNMLDGLESHPDFYKRTPIELGDGTKVQTYILNNSYIKNCPIIKSGDWKNKN